VQQLTTERLQNLTMDPDVRTAHAAAELSEIMTYQPDVLTWRLGHMQEAVRQSVVPLLTPLARRLSPDQRNESILPAITSLCSDDEPATRLAFATQLHEVPSTLHLR